MEGLVIRFGLGRIVVGAVCLVMIVAGATVQLAAFLAGVFACAAALYLDDLVP